MRKRNKELHCQFAKKKFYYTEMLKQKKETLKAFFRDVDWALQVKRPTI
jgi:hypothetical protein